MTFAQFIELLGRKGCQVEVVLHEASETMFTWRVIAPGGAFDFHLAGNPSWQIDPEVRDETLEALGLHVPAEQLSKRLS